MSDPAPRPWWWPSIRDVAVVGFFLLTVMIFGMIWLRPGLTDNQGFMFLAQAVIVSGLIGAVAAFLFQVQKSAQEAKAAQDQVSRAIDALSASTPAAAGPAAPSPPPGTARITADVAAPATAEIRPGPATEDAELFDPPPADR